MALTFALVVALLASACTNAPTVPAPAANALLGTWASVSSAPSTTGTCANFQWGITEMSGLTVSGTFSATCAGSLQVTGTGSGTLTMTSLDWKVAGTASGATVPSCAVILAGSASLQTDGTIVIPYSGTTCQGAVSGTQTIRKR